MSGCVGDVIKKMRVENVFMKKTKWMIALPLVAVFLLSLILIPGMFSLSVKEDIALPNTAATADLIAGQDHLPDEMLAPAAVPPQAYKTPAAYGTKQEAYGTDGASHDTITTMAAPVEPIWTTTITVSTQSALQNAINSATRPTCIKLSGNITLTQTITFPDGKIIKIMSNVSGTKRTLDGNNTGRVIADWWTPSVVIGITLWMEDIVITRGYADYGGGIDLCANIVLNRVTITDNKANVSGGGIYLIRRNSNTFFMTDCTITNNSGGGIYAATCGTMTNCNISNNSGGGIILSYSSKDAPSPVNIVGCTISDNSSNGNGGGIYAWIGTVSHDRYNLNITDSTISNNTSGGNGGGIYLDADGFTEGVNCNITNSTISNNKTAGSGGGIYFTGSDLMNGARCYLHDIRVSKNIAAIGSGIYLDYAFPFYVSGVIQIGSETDTNAITRRHTRQIITIIDPPGSSTSLQDGTHINIDPCEGDWQFTTAIVERQSNYTSIADKELGYFKYMSDDYTLGKIGSRSNAMYLFPTMVGLEISKQPLKTTYIVGEALELEGLSLLGKLKDGQTTDFRYPALIQNDYITSPAEGTILNTVGTQTVTVTRTYGNVTMSVSFTVTVYAESAERFSTAFPDENFRTEVLSLLNADGGSRTSSSIITETDFATLAQITSLDVSGKNINDLIGIGYFTGLTSLRCDNNSLTSLDVSKNTALESLACNNNQLTGLDLSDNYNLTHLQCFNNKLNTLDVSYNPELVLLSCYNNNLASLDVSHNYELRTVYCNFNRISNLDFSNNANLYVLNCKDNQLTNLVLSNSILVSLNCSNNKLTELDLSNSTNLNVLFCDDNELTELDLSNHVKLESFFCTGNKLTAVHFSIKGISCSVTANGNGYVGVISYFHFISDEIITTVEATPIPDSEFFHWTLDGNVVATTESYDIILQDSCSLVANFTATTGTSFAEAFPDENFRTKVLDLLNTDGGNRTSKSVMTEADIAALAKITSLDVYSKGIKNMTGLEYFTELTQLSCNDNQLTSLDVSQNTALKQLNCSGNQLTSLDISNNYSLVTLNCSNNQLSELDIANNNELVNLYCSMNQLTWLDISSNYELKILDCSGNELTELDTSHNSALTDLNCSNNQLSLLEIWYNYDLVKLDCSDNQLTELDISNNYELVELNCGHNRLTRLDLTIQYALARLDCSYNQLTWLYISNQIELTNLNCSNNQISDLDIANHYELKTLDCSGNALTELDVSHNSALTELRCANNQLSSIEIWYNYDLEILDCSGNQLTELDISNNYQLLELNCSYNQLTRLDLTNPDALTRLDCSHNRLTWLDVSNNAQLKYLDCSGNNMQSTSDVIGWQEIGLVLDETFIFDEQN